jgi:hypothetical protein
MLPALHAAVSRLADFSGAFFYRARYELEMMVVRLETLGAFTSSHPPRHWTNILNSSLLRLLLFWHHAYLMHHASDSTFADVRRRRK